MGRNAVILHGTGETDGSFWLPYIKKDLEAKGYFVSIPLLPDAGNPRLSNWLPVALKEAYTKDTVLIGHSAGCPLALSVLERLDSGIKQAILVSGYARKLGASTGPGEDPILQGRYDWGRIGRNVTDLVLLNSDNDPWGCNDIEGRHILDSIGKGKLIVMKGEGHMGSDRFKQPYREFPFLAKLID